MMVATSSDNQTVQNRMSWTGLVPIESSGTAEIVVGLDFGSTHSGFAWALRSEPAKIHKFYDWPDMGAAGEKHYCKTKTCLWYKHGPTPGSFNLQAWGYSALLGFSAASQKHEHYSKRAGVSTSTTPSTLAPDHDQSAGGDVNEVGYLATLFKPILSNHVPSDDFEAKIPAGLTVERMISDFLREIGGLALTTLQKCLNRHVTKADVQWSITVPGIWDKAAKQTMRTCVQMAGLVHGPACESECASPFPLTVVLEPEAASVYCQHNMHDVVECHPGVKFLILDVGGFTVDLSIHERLDTSSSNQTFSSCSPVSGKDGAAGQDLKLREMTVGTGDYCGGSAVDKRFIKFLRKKLSGYDDISKSLPESILKVMSRWEKVKNSFEGKEDFASRIELPARLARAWEDRVRLSKGLNCIRPDELESESQSESEYDSVNISVADMKNIFEPSVRKTLALIEKQINEAKDLLTSTVTVVGGFSASPYLRDRIFSAFSSKVGKIVFPDEPGCAICCGAVVLGMNGVDMISTRFARKSYGISINRPFRTGDPADLPMATKIPGTHSPRTDDPSAPSEIPGSPILRSNDSLCLTSEPCEQMQEATEHYNCGDTTDVLSRKGYRPTRKYVAPTNPHKTKINLYSSSSFDLLQVRDIAPTNGSVTKDGTCVIHHPSTAALEVSMYFGRIWIEADTVCLNFLKDAFVDNKLTVTFKHCFE